MSAKTTFRDNLRRLVGEWRAGGTSRTIRTFTRTVFWWDAETAHDSRYKWVRKLLSEGSPQKADGRANHDALKALHRFSGLPWPSLWSPAPATPAERLGRLWADMPRGDEADALRDEILVTLSVWEGRAREAEWPDDPAELISRWAVRHPDLWGRMLADGRTSAGLANSARRAMEEKKLSPAVLARKLSEKMLLRYGEQRPSSLTTDESAEAVKNAASSQGVVEGTEASIRSPEAKTPPAAAEAASVVEQPNFSPTTGESTLR